MTTSGEDRDRDSESGEAAVVSWLHDAPTFDAVSVLAANEPGWFGLLERAQAVGPAPELAGLDDAALVAELGRRSSRMAAAMCTYLELVAELTVRGVWGDQGARTPGAWLSFELGLGASTAADHIRVGLRLRELPRIRDRFAQGRISYAKVRAITRIAVPEIEELLLQWADHATGAQVERIIGAFRASCRAPDQEDDAALERRCRVRSRRNGDGTTTLTIRTRDEDAASIEAALDRLADLEPSSEEDGESRPTRDGQRIGALVAACAAAVDAGGVDTSGLDRHTLVLHADLADLTDLPGAGPDAATRQVAIDSPTGRLRTMSAAVLRRLACEAGMVLVATDGPLPIDVGRRQRRPTAAQRRALQVRDRSCRFPGCGVRRHLHAHHVVHWADDGPTDLANLVLVCGFHHRFVHERRWQVTAADGGTFTFAPPSGPPLPTIGRLPGIAAASSAEDAAEAGAADPGAAPTPLRPRDWFPDAAYLEVAVSVLHQELRAS